MGKKLTTSDFIAKAKAVHGDKYDYSKVVYVKNIIPIIINCPEHGEFNQKPADHLNNRGCPECGKIIRGNKRRFTTEDFVKRAKEAHGDKYDYSKVLYIGNMDKVIIICLEHGEFEQEPSNHWQGVGCPKCHGMGKSTEEFIDEARAVHGDKYDYSKTIYKGTKYKITIICRKHGEWEQSPSSHLNSNGCPKCHGRGKTTENIIDEARAVHGDKYDYSKSEYVRAKDKIIIICSEHGEFLKSPDKHIRGKQGCPKCNGKGFKFKTFEEVREIIKQQGIKTELEYRNWWERNKEFCHDNGIPKQPDAYYKKNQ